MVQKTLVPIYLTIFIIFVFACAKQMPPRGGPVDRTPPTIKEIIPTPGQTNVALDTKIEIVFSERMQPNTVEEAIFISPWPSEVIEFDWGGKKLKIKFSDNLKRNRTYVLTIGARSSDLRNNRMEDSYSIAFSTGDIIDQGEITGRVYNKADVEGTLVCAYDLQVNAAPDPTEILADYYTQCNAEGNYNLAYVAPGHYRLFAIDDKDFNRKYTKGIDAIGITNSDVTLISEENTVNDVHFMLTVEDTAAPVLKSAYSIDKNKIEIRFSEKMDSFENEKPDKYFSISPEEDSLTKLKILSCYQNLRDKSQMLLMTEDQADIPYILTADNLFDISGNSLDTAYNSIVFNGSAIPDTMEPVLIYQSIIDSSTAICPDTTIQFMFSEPVKQELLADNVVFRRANAEKINGTIIWNNPAAFTFTPYSALQYFTGYQITAMVDSIQDLAGNSLKDSLFSVYFKTQSEDTLSAISGQLIDQDSTASGNIYLTAKSAGHFYHTMIEKPGQYSFDDILSGIYTIQAFRDADSNGVYSYGQTIPFQPAERFVFYPDSIKLRSGWPNEGNDIILK